MIYIVLIESKLANGHCADLVRVEEPGEPDSFEIHQKLTDGVVKIKHTVDNLVDAIVRFNQLVEDLCMTQKV